MFSHLTVPEFLRMGAYAAIGLLMIGYGLFVRRAATGTAFYTVFLFGGTVLLLFAVCVPLHVWEKLPKGIRIAFLVCLTIGLMLFLFVEALIIRHFGDKEEDVDYLIVLGAQVFEDRPSLVLKYRLDRAAEYLAAHPDTICIVSGGQGTNEPFPEAEGMYRYLTEEMGIDGARIIKEPNSSNTVENLKFSLELLPGADVKVGIVTNNFHIFRSLGIAKKQGYKNAAPVVSPSKKEYLPTNMLREFVGVIKDFLFGNM